LTFEEARQINASRSQIVTLKKGQNFKYRPHAFTEHGAIMLASILNSRVAVQASVYVVRAFVQMRTSLVEHDLDGSEDLESKHLSEAVQLTVNEKLAGSRSAFWGFLVGHLTSDPSMSDPDLGQGYRFRRVYFPAPRPIF
jgi:hypothetical protein